MDPLNKKEGDFLPIRNEEEMFVTNYGKKRALHMLHVYSRALLLPVCTFLPHSRLEWKNNHVPHSCISVNFC